MVRLAQRFTIINHQLYRKSFSLPYLKCLGPDISRKVLEEVHEGVCASHVGARTLAQKILRQGYYWPTVMKDAEAYVSKCERCQLYSRIPRAPAEPLTNIVAPWPFAQWGMDIVGPLPAATRQRRFLIVAIDYFTKWIEAEPTASITGRTIQKFFEHSVVCRFGIPHTLITDNGKQFEST